MHLRLELGPHLSLWYKPCMRLASNAGIHATSKSYGRHGCTLLA